MNRYQKACYKMAKDRVKDERNYVHPDYVDFALQYFYSVEKMSNKIIPLNLVLKMAYGKEN